MVILVCQSSSSLPHSVLQPPKTQIVKHGETKSLRPVDPFPVSRTPSCTRAIRRRGKSRGLIPPLSSVFITRIVYVAPFSMRFRTAAVRPFSSSSSLSRFLSPFLSHPSSTRFFSTRRLRVFRYGLNLIRRYRGSLYFYTKSSRRLRC